MTGQRVRPGGVGTYLEAILEARRAELDHDRRRTDPGEVAPIAEPGAFRRALAGGTRPRLICEIKRASPSRGPLNPIPSVGDLGRIYQEAGASAISVLTETRYFQGRPGDLEAVRRSVSIPVLRKDFLFDPVQIRESAAMGAQAILLIVAILEPGQLADLMAEGRSLGMDVLVEVHDAAELEVALEVGAGIIGINNRDLRSFEVDVNRAQDLIPSVPPGKIVVAESGYSNHDAIQRVDASGASAILVGEALVTATDPARMIRALRGADEGISEPQA